MGEKIQNIRWPSSYFFTFPLMSLLHKYIKYKQSIYIYICFSLRNAFKYRKVVWYSYYYRIPIRCELKTLFNVKGNEGEIFSGSSCYWKICQFYELVSRISCRARLTATALKTVYSSVNLQCWCKSAITNLLQCLI